MFPHFFSWFFSIFCFILLILGGCFCLIFSIFPDFSRFFQIFPDFSRFFQIFPVFFLGSSRFLWTMTSFILNTLRFFSIFLISSHWSWFFSFPFIWFPIFLDRLWTLYRVLLGFSLTFIFAIFLPFSWFMLPWLPVFHLIYFHCTPYRVLPSFTEFSWIDLIFSSFLFDFFSFLLFFFYWNLSYFIKSLHYFKISSIYFLFFAELSRSDQVYLVLPSFSEPTAVTNGFSWFSVEIATISKFVLKWFHQSKDLLPSFIHSLPSFVGSYLLRLDWIIRDGFFLFFLFFLPQSIHGRPTFY